MLESSSIQLNVFHTNCILSPFRELNDGVSRIVPAQEKFESEMRYFSRNAWKNPQMYLAVCIICSVADYGTHFQARIGVPGCGTWSGCSQDAQSWLLQGRNLIFFSKALCVCHPH